MTRKHSSIAISISGLVITLALAGLTLGCQNGEAERSAADGSEQTAEPTATEPAAAAQTAAEVTFEPAYPAEVSDETLSEEDKAQQATSHSHGSDEHAHDDGEEPAHDDGEEPAHDDGEEPAHDDGEEPAHDEDGAGDQHH